MTPQEIYNHIKDHNLFHGFNSHQLAQVASLVKVITYQPGDIIIREGEISDNIYIVQHGIVDIEKFESTNDHPHCIAQLQEDDVIGEISLLDNAPRSATVKAHTVATLYALSIQEVRQCSRKQIDYATLAQHIDEVAKEAHNMEKSQPFFPLIIQNLAKGLSKRLRSTNDAVVASLKKELEHTKARAAIGLFIVLVLAFLSFYVFVLKILEQYGVRFAITTVISVPLIVVFALISYWLMRNVGYPLEMFGLTLKHARLAIKEAMIFTLGFMIVCVWMKLYLLHFSPAYQGKPFIYLSQIGRQYGLPKEIFWIAMYLIFAPLQEFIVRGALQSSLQELLIGKHKVISAIFISNLLFAVTHLHVSISMGLSVFALGLCWGWLYSRNRTLIGVSISHIICGFWAFWVMGLFR